MKEKSESLTPWIKTYLAELIGEPIETINVNESLSYFDLDSVDAVTMGLRLEDEFGIAIHPETFLNENASLADVIKEIVENSTQDQVEGL